MTKYNSMDEKDLYAIATRYKVNEAKIDSKVEDDRKYAEWQMFFLNNMDIFTEYYLGIKLHHFQRQLLLKCMKYDVLDVITARGLSK